VRSSRLLLAAAGALLAAGCGGGSTGTGTVAPTASAPDATAPPPDATQPGTGPVTPPPATATQPAQTQTTPSSGGDDASAGGGEQSVRVPASFVVAPGGRLRPPTITVPPFLAVEISVRSADGRAHRLVVRTPTPQTLDVAAGGRAAVRIPGLHAGRYAVALDGRAAAGTLVAGGEVGP
jgi:hypothetical protein